MTEPAAPPTLGVVVVSYNTRELLDRCLSSLREALAIAAQAAPAEVHVVDNASTDGSADWVARHQPWVRLHALTENRGFTAGNNVVLGPWAASETACPTWVLLLNPDTEVRPGVVEQLIAALRDRPTAGLAGPRLVYPDGRFQHAAFRFPGLLQTWLDLVPVARLMDSPLNGRYGRERYEAGQPFAVDFPLGACLMARGDAFRRVGPLDEGYFMYCEEIDWARRFRAAHYGALCVPAATVLHHGGASTGQFREAMFVQLWRSRRRYFAQHAGPARRALLEATLRLGLSVRAARDRRAERLGEISAEERARRRSAYRQVLAAATG